jgi:excisionase family DNA binding protein
MPADLRATTAGQPFAWFAVVSYLSISWYTLGEGGMLAMTETTEDIRVIRELLSGRGSVTIQAKDGTAITASKSAVRAAIMESEEPEVVTTEEAARILNVSRPYVVKLTDTGELASITTQGGHRRIRLADLMRCKEEMARIRDEGIRELIAIGEDDGTYTRILEEIRK